MTNIASAPAGASGLSAMRRSQVRMRAEAIQADRRAQVLDRVDRLVRGMEAVARLWPETREIAPGILQQVANDALYEGYLDRQQADIAAYRKDETLALPEDLDYAAIGGLSNEMQEKLQTTRPATLGAAGRIPGVTPAALTALLRHVRRIAA